MEWFSACLFILVGVLLIVSAITRLPRAERSWMKTFWMGLVLVGVLCLIVGGGSILGMLLMAGLEPQLKYWIPAIAGDLFLATIIGVVFCFCVMSLIRLRKERDLIGIIATILFVLAMNVMTWILCGTIYDQWKHRPATVAAPAVPETSQSVETKK